MRRNYTAPDVAEAKCKSPKANPTSSTRSDALSCCRLEAVRLRSDPVVRQKLRGTLNARPQQFAANATTLKGRYTSSILTLREEFVTSGPMERKLLILRRLTRFE